MIIPTAILSKNLKILKKHDYYTVIRRTFVSLNKSNNFLCVNMKYYNICKRFSGRGKLPETIKKASDTTSSKIGPSHNNNDQGVTPKSPTQFLRENSSKTEPSLSNNEDDVKQNPEVNLATPLKPLTKSESVREKIENANLNPKDSNISMRVFRDTSETKDSEEKSSSDVSDYLQSTTVERFTKYFNNGIIDDPNNRESKLTPSAYDYHRALEPKIQLKNAQETSIEEQNILFESQESLEDFSETKTEFRVGTLAVQEEKTAMLTPEQTHLIVGVEDKETNEIVGFTLLTSEKGQKAGITGYVLTVKVSDTQPISRQTDKAQYARSLYPPLRINPCDFNENEDASNIINGDPDAVKTLEMLKSVTEHMEPKHYTGAGFTDERLEEISDIMLSNKQNVETFDESKDID